MIDELKWQWLTGVVNNMPRTNIFLTRLLYSREKNLPTENVRIETKTMNRTMAPFVRKNGEAIMVGGPTAGGYLVECPNIRIKRPFTPSQQLYNRMPGDGNILNPTESDVMNAVEAHLREDIQVMNDMATNTEEYMVAMSLQGQLTYAVEDEEVFQITYPKPSANNVTMTVFLDDATPADVRFLAVLDTCKQIVSDDGSPALTDAIHGEESADALRELVESGALKWLNTASGNPVTAGSYSFVEQFRDDGVLYMGEMGGLRHWRYTRTAYLNGVEVSMIRPKYCELVSTSPATDRIMYYGVIPDMSALKGRSIQRKRFMKSWEQQDPSAIMSLLHTRPLPVPRRPGASVSLKTVSG